MNTRGWLQDKPEIAEPARTDTLDHYGPATCCEEGCELPARYHGRCFTHWRKAMAEEAKAPPAAMTDDQMREVIQEATSNAHAMKALGMPAGSGVKLAKLCKRLDVDLPAVRMGRAAGKKRPSLPVHVPVSPTPVATRHLFTTTTNPAELVPIVPVLKAVEAVAVILRALPDEHRKLVAETAARIASAA